MRGTVRMGSAVLLVALAALTALPAHAQQSVSATETPVPGESAPPVPFAGISADISRVTGELDEATARALELETEIEALEAERAALEERLAVTAERIRTQRAELRAAEERLDEARERYQARLVEVYKRGAINPITLLFSSDTLTELVSRAGILTRIAEDDSRVVSDLTVAAADARYQATALEELLAQDKQLQAAQRERIASLERALDEQESLVAKLTVEAREALLKARRFTAETRAQWRAASIPIGTAIPGRPPRANRTPGSRTRSRRTCRAPTAPQGGRGRPLRVGTDPASTDATPPRARCSTRTTTRAPRARCLSARCSRSRGTAVA